MVLFINVKKRNITTGKVIVTYNVSTTNRDHLQVNQIYINVKIKQIKTEVMKTNSFPKYPYEPFVYVVINIK